MLHFAEVRGRIGLREVWQRVHKVVGYGPRCENMINP